MLTVQTVLSLGGMGWKTTPWAPEGARAWGQPTVQAAPALRGTYRSQWAGVAQGSIPLLCLEGVPDLHGAPQDEASLTKKFET